MADLNAILNTISSAVYGVDVRQGIYDGIKFIHDEYQTIKSVADQVRSLINIYEQAVDDAKSLTATLKEQIQTGSSLKKDLAGLSNSLSDGRKVLADLKSENEKATTALEEAREKIPVLQDLLSRIPDLQEAERITGELETAYNNASQALDELNGLSGTIDQLTSLNAEAKQNLADYESARADIESLKQDVAYNNANDALERLTNVEGTITQLTDLNTQAETNLAGYEAAKSDIDSLVEKTTQVESMVTGYPDIIQALEDAYNKVTEKTVDLEELSRLLSEIETNVQIINENKQNLQLVVDNIEVIKKLGEIDLSGVLEIESRVQALEQKEDLTPRVKALEEKEDLTPRVENLETELAGVGEALESLI